MCNDSAAQLCIATGFVSGDPFNAVQTLVTSVDWRSQGAMPPGNFKHI